MAITAGNAGEQLVLSFFAALNAKDAQALALVVHEDVVWSIKLSDNPDANIITGLPGVIAHYLEGGKGVFVDGGPTSTVDALVSSADRVMAETTGSGQRLDGTPYRNFYAWAFELGDGKIRTVREYMDSLYAMRFFGLV